MTQRKIVVLAIGFNLIAIAPAWAGSVSVQHGTAGSDWVNGGGMPDDSKTGTMGVLNAAANIAMDGRSGVSVLLSGTWSGTVVAEVSSDGGTTWAASNLYNYADGTINASVTANGTYAIVPTHGVSHVRVKMSVYNSGTATAKFRTTANNSLTRTTAGTGAGADQIQGTAADAAAAVGNPVQIGGKDGAGNIQAVLTDTGGAVQVDIESIAAGDNNIGNVDIASSIPAGTNAIGKLAANSGVDIGDVDVTSIAAGDNNIGNVDVLSISAGNNNIGDVDIASIAAGNNNIGDVDVATIAAGDNNIGNVDVLSIAAGNNNIGDVDIASIAAGDNNIGNVDVLSIAAGNNNIGDVDVATIAAGNNNIGDVDVATIAAGDNNIGNVDVLSISAGNNNIGDVDVASIAAGDNNIGNVDIVTLPALATGPIASAAQTTITNGVATQLIVGSTPCKQVILVSDDGAAANGNTVVIWVGGSSVAANNGIPLRVGANLTLEVGNANTIWLFAGSANQKVSWTAVN